MQLWKGHIFGTQPDISNVSFMVPLNAKRLEEKNTPAGIGLSSNSRVGEANSIGGHPWEPPPRVKKHPPKTKVKVGD